MTTFILKSAYDTEYDAAEKHCISVLPNKTGTVPGESSIVTLYARVQRFVGRLGAEQQVINKVPQSERINRHTWKVDNTVRSQKFEVLRPGPTQLDG